MKQLSADAQFALLSADLKQELLDFLDFLVQKQQKRQEALPKKELKFGDFAGAFSLSPDFDAPLEDFNDYM